MKIILILFLSLSVFNNILSDDIGRDWRDDIEWCLIPPGDFLFGQPGQMVTEYTESYEIMKYEVTNQQYLNFLNELYDNGNGPLWFWDDYIMGPYEGDTVYPQDDYKYYYMGGSDGNCGRINWDGSNFYITYPSEHGDHEFYLNTPVICVTWFGARAFAEYCGWRLPSDLEWEKAARGDDSRIYPWGDVLVHPDNRANYLNSSDPWDQGTTPVDMYDGNETYGWSDGNGLSPFGVYNMCGNAYEWIASAFNPGDPTYRVLRGGSWYWMHYFSHFLKTWARGQQPPDVTYDDHGFRCARDRTLPAPSSMNSRFETGVGIVLSWTPSIGATSYKIYRATDPYLDVSSMEMVAEITENTWIDPEALTAESYFYKVVAVFPDE